MLERTNFPLLDLYLSYDQWKEEHQALSIRLRELCMLVSWHPGNYDFTAWDDHHREVRKLFITFMQDWQKHLYCEQQTIFPLARSAICGGAIGPVAVLEQDGSIAIQFYESYLQATADGAASEEALRLLQQVLMIINEHFRVEDENIVPVTDRLMEEIDYSGL